MACRPGSLGLLARGIHPDVTAIRYDIEGLRLERVARLQEAMRKHGVDVCVLSNEPNVRYATGTTAMPVYSMSTFVRCVVVPQEGTPILFEHCEFDASIGSPYPRRASMRAWEFYDDPPTGHEAWADETLAAIRELGASGRRWPSTGWARRHTSRRAAAE